MFLVVIVEISNYICVMRYPFATFIVTVAIFASMFLLIFTGELRIFADNTPKPPINIIDASITCPVIKGAANKEYDISDEIAKLCQGKNACEINSKNLIASSGKGKKNCTEELRIEYSCKSKNLYQAKTHTVFLYQGQIATIQCGANDY
jgi:hypothetical protein